MVTSVDTGSIQSLRIVKEVLIKASPEIAFAAMLEEIGAECETPDGTPMPMVVETFPGGRWFRDLGDGAGHLWGHVQVIKPPLLLELSGPMFMSYAASNHIQYRLREEAGGTLLTLTHTAIGLISDVHRTGVANGWDHGLNRIARIAERQVRQESPS